MCVCVAGWVGGWGEGREKRDSVEDEDAILYA